MIYILVGAEIQAALLSLGGDIAVDRFELEEAPGWIDWDGWRAWSGPDGIVQLGTGKKWHARGRRLGLESMLMWPGAKRLAVISTEGRRVELNGRVWTPGLLDPD